MKSNLISITLAFTILFSSCSINREVTPPPTVDDPPQPILTYEEFVELNLYDKTFTITDFTSRRLGISSYKEDIAEVAPFALIATGTFIIIPMVNTTMGAFLLGIYAAAIPSYIPIVAFHLIGGKEANIYRQQLEHLSLNAVEEILHDDLGFNYVSQDQTSKNDSVYSIQIEFNYTYIRESGAINTFSNEIDNLKFKNRVESPTLQVVWTIVAPDGKEVAKIATSNRFYNIVPNRVYPRNPELQGSYIELASQSAESFLSLLKGEADTHIPSSPLAILGNSDARIINHRAIGQYSFTSLRDRLISQNRSRDQYLITIDKGSLAGYEENKKYYVLYTSEEHEMNDYDLYIYNYCQYVQCIFTYDYFLRNYKPAGEFEVLVAEEDMSVGIFRPWKSFEQTDQIDFDALVVRIYNPYRGMHLESRSYMMY